MDFPLPSFPCYAPPSFILVPMLSALLSEKLTRQNRTHRERKELYIKTLEDELLRLKEAFTNVSQDKDKLAEENRHLKTLLRQNGISYEHTGESPTVPSLGYTSSPSVSGNNYQPGSQSAFTPPLTSQSLASSMSPPLHVPLSAKSNLIPPGISAQQLQHSPAQRADVSTGIDYEQAGIDFVLRYEVPLRKISPSCKAIGDGTAFTCEHYIASSHTVCLYSRRGEGCCVYRHYRQENKELRLFC